jgi:hypothetical protein
MSFSGYVLSLPRPSTTRAVYSVFELILNALVTLCWPVLSEKVSIWMQEAEQIAVAGYKRVLENGPEKCSSESDSENSDHGEAWEYSEMYTPDMLSPDGKPKKSGPQRLSTTRALVLRAAAHAAPSSTGPSRPGTPSTSVTEGEDSVDEWYQANLEVPKCVKEVSSRLLTPLNSDNEDDAEEMTWDQRRHVAIAKKKSGRAGGLVTAVGSEKTDTCTARRRPFHT